MIQIATYHGLVTVPLLYIGLLFAIFYFNDFLLYRLQPKFKSSSNISDLSQCMRFPTMWYDRPAKPQISLRIHAVWSELLLVAWVFYDCSATDWTSFGVPKLKMRLHRLVWVYTCQNATLLEIMCRGSFTILWSIVRLGRPGLVATFF